MPAAKTFEAAREQIARLRAAETADPRIDPERRSFALDHGHRTDRAVVFLHGITSSPPQFQELAELFFDQGYNVLVPRMPRHGFADRLTRDPARLTRRELVAYTNEAVDAGRGLADHLTVGGLSVSGTLAAWAFQHRSDVDLAVLIAPAFAPYAVPLPAVKALIAIAQRLPNFFLWWDPRVGARLRTPAGYPWFSTRAMAESFRLGYEIYQAAATEPPGGRVVLAITNPGDRAVSTPATRTVLARWARYPGSLIHFYQFSRDLGPLHDVIGP